MKKGSTTMKNLILARVTAGAATALGLALAVLGLFVPADLDPHRGVIALGGLMAGAPWVMLQIAGVPAPRYRRKGGAR